LKLFSLINSRIVSFGIIDIKIFLPDFEFITLILVSKEDA